MSGVVAPLSRLRAGLASLLLAIPTVAGFAAPASGQPVGSVSGTVRASGAPLANAWVTVMPVTPTGDWGGKPTQTTTDRNGRYEFGDVAAEHVKVHVRAPSFTGLVSTYWPDAYSFATAGTLRVESAGTTADVELAAGGSVSGRVVDADTGRPIAGARVLAHVDAPPGWESVGSSGLAPGPGQFVVDGLPPVPITLQVRAPQGSNHLGQWFDGAGFFGEADPVQPGTTGIVVRLREGAEVGGVVLDDEGGPVAGAAVTIIGCSALCPASALTDDTGRYRITGVPPGPGVRAYADAASEGLLDRWYAAPGESGYSTFDLTVGQVRRDVDFTLTAGAVVLGRVLDEQTGLGIPGVSIELVDVDNPLRSHLSRDAGSPGDGRVPASPARPSGASSASPEPSSPAGDQAAEVVIGPVPPGRYSLVVYPGAENSDYLPPELVGSTGLDPIGQLELVRGERAQVTVTLARQRTSTPGTPGRGGADPGTPGQGDAQEGAPTAPVPVDGQPDPAGSSGWPGLFAGFLAQGGGVLRLGS